jgi:mannose-6-phosphate isomerase-like protein (cupin superfamily)
MVDRGRMIDFGDGFTVTVKADDRQSGGVMSVLETTEPPGLSPPVHVHHDCAEAFYVLEGEYLMYVEGHEVLCGPGSFLFVPQGARHTFRTGDLPGRKLNVYVPAAMVGYFDDLAAALGRGDVDDDELSAIAAAHAMEIVGPPPDRYI